MINMTVDQAKAGFFDRAKVQSAVDAATRRVLSKFGAFVRQRAKTSIRPRKSTSFPGYPPYSHTGLLRKGILFAWDGGKKSVVVGPTLLRAGPRAPAMLEHGGTATLKGRQANYRARPFMGPALAAELPGLEPMWKDSVK